MSTPRWRFSGILLSASLLVSPLVAAVKPGSKPSWAAQQTDGPVTYQELGESFMRSMGIEDENEIIGRPGDPKKVNLTVPELERQEKLLRLFVMYKEQEEQQGQAAKSTLMQSTIRTVLKDLDMFYGQGEDFAQHVFGRVNMAETTFGEVALAKMIADPVTDVKILRARQALIKKLCTDQRLFNELDALVREVKDNESEIFSFFVEENKPTREQINRHYFGTKSLNTNVVALEAGNRIGNLWTATLIGMPVVLPCVVTLLARRGLKAKIREDILEAFQEAGVAAPSDAEIDRRLNEELRVIGFGSNLSSMGTALKFYFDPRSYINEAVYVRRQGVRRLEKPGLGLGTKWGTIAYGGLHAVPLLITKLGYERGMQLNAALMYLQIRLISLATLINSVRAAHDMAATDPVLAQGLATRSKMADLFNPDARHSAELKQLIDLLQTDTFKGEASFFSLSGRVLAANTLVNKVKGQLMGGFEAFGEIDACLSIAKLMKRTNGDRATYSFVEFVDRATPYMKLDDFWNPLVDPKIVVLNNLELGGVDNARNVVLTGANTGGKSTILKAIIIDLLLAHSLTIAAAQSMVLTPFYYLGSSLNIADDTAAGFSLYQAEVNRAKVLLQASSLLKGPNFGFLVIDELFRGTSPEQAEAGSYECAKQLIGHQNTMFILATHFTKQTTVLEKETNGICKNYKVEVYKDQYGNLIRPYKLEPGINSTHVAGQILGAAMGSVAR